jgi:hypothetical protein
MKDLLNLNKNLSLQIQSSLFYVFWEHRRHGPLPFGALCGLSARQVHLAVLGSARAV